MEKYGMLTVEPDSKLDFGFLDLQCTCTFVGQYVD